MTMLRLGKHLPDLRANPVAHVLQIVSIPQSKQLGTSMQQTVAAKFSKYPAGQAPDATQLVTPSRIRIRLSPEHARQLVAEVHVSQSVIQAAHVVEDDRKNVSSQLVHVVVAVR